MKRRRLHLPGPGVVLLILLLSLGVWASWPENPLPVPRIDWHGNIQRGDQAAEDVVMRQFGANGLLDLMATAKEAYHDPHSRQTFLSDVTVHRFRPQGTLSLQAADGVVEDRNRLVTLTGNVEMSMPPDYRAITQRLQYDPKTGIITTNDPVRVTQGNNWLTGVGMRASVQEERIALLRDVRGYYAP